MSKHQAYASRRSSNARQGWRFRWVRACAACLLAVPMMAQGFGSWRIVVSDGDAVPGGSDQLEIRTGGVYEPLTRINDAGTIRFFAYLPQAGIKGMFTLSGPQTTTLNLLARGNQTTPALDGRFNDFYQTFVSGDGAVWFAAALDNVTQYGNFGLYRATTTSTSEQLRVGKPLGVASMVLCNSGVMGYPQYVRQNGGGAFVVDYVTTNGDCSDYEGALLGIAGNGQISVLARTGTVVSGASGATITDINAQSTALPFSFYDDNGSNGTLYFAGRDSRSNDWYWFSYNNGTVVRVAPTNAGSQLSTHISENNTLTLLNLNAGSSPPMYMINQYVNANVTPVTVVATNQLLPGGDGRFYTIHPVFDVSPTNEVVFGAQLSGTPGGTADDVGMYLADAQGIVEIAREGGAAPSGGVFRGFAMGTVGRNGRALFEASYQIGGSTRVGLFYYSRAHGRREILTKGVTAIGGYTVTNWGGSNGSGVHERDERINARGEVALDIRADNRGHIALFALSPSEVNLMFGDGFEGN